ncbi:N-acetylmuramoyl-L-alanine amidase family protein [Gorillibacterium timonense]|uniref:N-acetylmuramoyl-L-alanine amidase family protein n=1 Tax=Gorillibacterium timonense TaxID=1689269 RepID=UPI00071E5724|nr:N-acetylmuramoyl-L-alanine amidase [Gorillibacterium timonense]
MLFRSVLCSFVLAFASLFAGNATHALLSPTQTETLPSTGDPHLPSADVLLDAGHGGIDGGTFEGDILEKDINLKVALLLRKELIARKVDCVLNRSGDYALSEENRWQGARSRHLRDLGQRYGLTTVLEPSAVVSLHVNWTRNPKRLGPIVLYQPNNPKSHLLARVLQDALNRNAGTSNTPFPGKTYYLLRRIDAPTVIVEMGFLSNASDRRKLTDPAEQKKIAEALASAIADYLMLERCLPDSMPKESPAPSP